MYPTLNSREKVAEKFPSKIKSPAAIKTNLKKGATKTDKIFVIKIEKLSNFTNCNFTNSKEISIKTKFDN